MAFGLSGSDSGILMVGSDVVVTDFKDGGDPRAIDYYISAYAQVVQRDVIKTFLIKNVLKCKTYMTLRYPSNQHVSLNSTAI